MVKLFFNLLNNSILKDSNILKNKLRLEPNFNKLLIIFIYYDVLSQWLVSDIILRVPERLLIPTLAYFTIVSFSC
jgi:hypothetical protein